MKDNGWYFGGFEITKRELLACVTIIATMLLFGFIIADKIDTYQTNKNSEYYKAVHITDSDMFQYGMDTSLGNAFIYGNLEIVDPVTYPEIGGEYMYIEKVEEHYNMHTRTVTTTVNGKIHTRIETYWSWDFAGRESIHSQKIKFCGIEFDYSKIQIPNEDYIDTIKESGFIRFKYYGCKGPYTGTVYTDLRNGTILDESNFYNNNEINEVVDRLASNIKIVIFWIIWIVLICAVVYGFVYLDNNWLRD